MRFFNTAGPVNSEDHYCLNPFERIDLGEILFLIKQKNILFFMPPDRLEKHPVFCP